MSFHLSSSRMEIINIWIGNYENSGYTSFLGYFRHFALYKGGNVNLFDQDSRFYAIFL